MSIFKRFIRRLSAGGPSPAGGDDFSRRETLFTNGRRYRVRKNTVSWEWSFLAGEEVEFVAAGYSHYDSGWGFTFRTPASGEERSWFLHDEEPTALAAEVFSVVKRREETHLTESPPKAPGAAPFGD